MKPFTTMIMAGGRGERLSPLTRHQAKPAVRFGGIYYIIDFTLSNCVNSGSRRIFVLTQFASSSLERHIRRGWNRMFRIELGEFIEARPPQQYTGQEWYLATADCIYKNLDVLEAEDTEGVLILSGDHIYKMDYRKMILFHIKSDADFSIACVDFPIEKAKNLGVLTVEENGRVLSFDEKPDNPTPIPGNESKAFCSMGIYYFRKDFLIDILREDAKMKDSSHDFGKDIIPRLVERGENVYAFPFWDENKNELRYWRDIGTIDAYYDANMDLVDVNPVFNLYDPHWPIRSFNQELPPAKTVFNWVEAGRIGYAVDSLISPGVIVSGAKVEKSILSPEVHVHSYAYVSNSILFDRVTIGERAVVRNAIIDRNVSIPENAVIDGTNKDCIEKYHVTDNGIVVVTENNADLP